MATTFRSPQGIICGFLLLALGFAQAKELETAINNLPSLREEALANTEELRSSGNTPSMQDGLTAIAEALLPELVKLEAALNQRTPEETLTIIERDLQAEARDAEIRGHAERWGGTAVKLDAAATVIEHLEARISYSVWQLMEDNEGFDLSAWQKQWRDQEH